MCNDTDKYCNLEGKGVCSCDSHLSRFIEPRLLLLIREKESYGYELIQGINDFPFSDVSLDPGAVYRSLRSMEKEGLISSKWNTKGTGPAKRIYRVTRESEERLFAWVVSLKKRKKAIEKFIAAYGKQDRK